VNNELDAVGDAVLAGAGDDHRLHDINFS